MRWFIWLTLPISLTLVTGVAAFVSEPLGVIFGVAWWFAALLWIFITPIAILVVVVKWLNAPRAEVPPADLSTLGLTARSSSATESPVRQ